ncbi:hypothetical protein PVL29_018590 [Vitis rotundifolia]|uniref:TCTP domain-containing protein n=1 Tax=Vitis rotundifolia TaxID=103349 RepID=A0AA38Z6A1_VITRO|nr:hypothetical protein PVL29_018590 [Vitis rotundifolia]
MLVCQDLVTGDELLRDSFPNKKLFNGALLEVEGKWVVQGAIDVDIDDEGIEDQAVKVVDIVDTLRFSDLQFFVGESMQDDGCLVFAYYKDGATDPTFLYFAHGLKAD